MSTTPCGAKTRKGTPCTKPGMTNGRCKYHGGMTPRGGDSPHFVHGRYSRYVTGQIKEKIELFEDKDPLDILPELNLQRVLFSEYLSRFNDSILPSVGDIQSMFLWLSDIGRMVERIVKMRNDTALTAAEVTFLAVRITDVVRKYIADPDVQSAFINEIFAGIQTADAPAITGNSQ